VADCDCSRCCGRHCYWFVVVRCRCACGCCHGDSVPFTSCTDFAYSMQVGVH